MERTTFAKTKALERKRERFVRIVESRVNRTLDNLDSLGKCANKKSYHYSEKDVKKIFTVIDKKVKEIRSLFHASHQQKKRFTLE